MLAHVHSSLRLSDLCRAAIAASDDAGAALEQTFAERFGFPHALFFSYGRVALHALLTAMEWQGREVLCPAYTCAVIPHAITASGNRVVYVDSATDHFLPDVAQWATSASPKTAMAILTPLFGYPVDKNCDHTIRSKAPEAFVLYDEAQSYGASNANGFQMRDADGALFSLGLGKLVTSLSGGMLLLRDGALCRAVQAVRARYRAPSHGQMLELIAKGLAAWAAYREPVVSILAWLSLSHAGTSNGDDLYSEGLPGDGLIQPSEYQALVGLRQFRILQTTLADRRRLGEYFEVELGRHGFRTFAYTHPPTWPRFPFPVSDREATMRALQAARIQCGLFLSSICSNLPNAERWACSMINLPNWTGMSLAQANKVVDALVRLRDASPGALVWPGK